jgi:AcrR family transcriptional regulator
MKATSNKVELPEGGPRERLLAVARRLFYEEGVHVVGIDRILEEAGVAKASLYQHFGNRDGLVKAYLEEQFATRRVRIEAILGRYSTPRDQLVGLFDDTADNLANVNYRGCRFVNAAVEARGGESALDLTETYRSWLRSVLSERAEAGGAADPEGLGRQLALLYDGTAIAARFDTDRAETSAAVRSAAVTLIDAALPAAVAAQ